MQGEGIYFWNSVRLKYANRRRGIAEEAWRRRRVWGNMKKITRFVLLFCLIGLLLWTPCIQSHAEGIRKVRVGYLNRKGVSSSTEQYFGYTIDFLDELSKYTDWEYEYIQVEGDFSQQKETLMDMLSRGEIDILGGMDDTEELRKRFYYPSYDYARSYSVLAVPEDSSRWLEEDYDNWNGIRVAYYPGGEKRMELLKEFAAITGFTYKTVKCASKEEMFNTIAQGKADAMLKADLNMPSDYRSIVRFNPKSIYFAVSRKKPEIYKELNRGLYSLFQTFPEIEIELYKKFFVHKGHFHLSEENKKYIEGLGTLKVLFFQGNEPVQGRDTSGKALGVAASFFKKMCEEVGLEYEPVFAEDYESGLKMVSRREVDLVAAVPFDGRLPLDGNLILSRPYFDSYGIIVTNGKKVEKDAADIQWPAANVESRLHKMKDSLESQSLLDANCVSFYTRKKGLYDGLEFNWGTTTPIRYSVGIGDVKYEPLLDLINRYSGSLPDDVFQEMLYENAHDPVEYTLPEFLFSYRWAVFRFTAVIVVIVALLIIYQRNKEYKRKALESDRVYQFSHLINECIFEYDFKNDKMNVQNSQIFFPGETVIHEFSDRFQIVTEEKHKKELQFLLYEMLMDKKEQKDISVNKDGEACWYRIQIKYIGDKQECAIGKIIDVNQDTLIKKDLERQVNTDALTGLFNRKAAENFVSRFLLDKENVGIMVLLDIDNFKNVNDTFGHLVGDQVLQEFARVLKKSFRQGDIKVRLGGDEFAVLMTGFMTEEQLGDKLQKVIDDMDAQLFSKYPECNLSVSIGAAYTGEQTNDYQMLYKYADNAMYVAKFGGKNDYFIAEDIVCMKRGCDNCRPLCKRRDYLMKRGTFHYSEENPEKIVIAEEKLQFRR